MRLKQQIDDLAVFGGAPAFHETLHVGRPNLGDEEKLFARFRDILNRRWLTNHGPYVQEFEQALARFVDVKHCIALCNATIGLEVAIRALGLRGEVIVPSFTFVASAHALQWQEITPVFCDVDPETHNLDPEGIERLITPRTTGILGVHLWGRACDSEALTAIARRRKLKLLFDAAHAFGCSHGGQMIGGFGECEVFSFHATKFLNTFEGGAIATNDDELAGRIRLMTNFGFSGYDNVVYLGTNGKMTEICAAMGVTSLESIRDIVAVNRANYLRYREELRDIAGFCLINYDEREHNNYQYVVVEVDAVKCGITRDDLVRILQAENVMARRYFFPGCHRMEPYRSYFPNAGLLLPETEKLCDTVLALPTGQAVNDDTVARVCQIMRCAVTHAKSVKHRLEALTAG